MAISLKHAFDSPVADEQDPELVGPDEWNAEHVLTQAGERLLGKATAGGGATEELTAADVRALLEVETTAETAAAIAVVQSDVDAHEADTANPHSVTKAQVGLGSADNTADADKPVSTATQAALDGKAPLNASIYLLSDYASLQAACDATQTGDGGIVFVDVNAALGTTKLDLDDFVKPLRITGANVANGGGAWVPYIRYAGTGSAITLANTSCVEIDHCFIWTEVAGVTAVNAKDASNFQLHNNTIYQPTTSASNIGVDLDTAVSPQIIRNSIFSVGGIGIRGVAPAGSFSVRAEIARNYFGTDTNTSISSPGQAWSIVGNTAQNPATCFLAAGPAGTCDTLFVGYNDIDDITGTKTIINSNAQSLVSKSNRFAYVSGTITCISQADTTGTVLSEGDRLSGTVGVAIGTGNYLSIKGHNKTYPPTTLYTGTPANTDAVETIGGPVNITGKVTLGIEGVYGGAQRFWSSNSGYVELVVGATALGSNTVTIPAHSGSTLLSNTGSQGVQNKNIDNTNTVTLRDDRFTLQDNGDTTKQLVWQLSGIATATTRTLTVPDASGTLALTSNKLSAFAATTSAELAGVISDETGSGALVFATSPSLVTPALGVATATRLTVGSGADASSLGTVDFYINSPSTAQFAVRDSGNDIELGMFTNTFGGGLAAMGTRTNHPFWIQTNSANSFAFHVSKGFSAGDTIDPGAGFISATGGIISKSATGGVGYTAGAGNAITQITSRTTGVTINNVCGAITLFNAAGTTTYTTFTVTNSAVAATDTVLVSCKSSTNVYTVHVSAVAAGSFNITFNTTGGTASDSPVFNFAVVKAVAA